MSDPQYHFTVEQCKRIQGFFVQRGVAVETWEAWQHDVTGHYDVISEYDPLDNQYKYLAPAYTPDDVMRGLRQAYDIDEADIYTVLLAVLDDIESREEE